MGAAVSNWSTPKAATQLLMALYSNNQNLLSKKSYNLLWKLMKATETGKSRLKGLLPTGTIVAHKTGTSGTKDSTIAAVNDIGVVYLPNGRVFFISVFVNNSGETMNNTEKIIAGIAKAAWDYFLVNH